MNRLLRDFRLLAQDVVTYLDNGHVEPVVAHELDRFARSLLNRMAPRKHTVKAPLPRSARNTKAERKAGRREQTSRVREACMTRSGGYCENCKAWDPWPEMDHFHGGASRPASNSVSGCWMLCRTCHRLKTNNLPTGSHWVILWQNHCARFDYDWAPPLSSRMAR